MNRLVLPLILLFAAAVLFVGTIATGSRAQPAGQRYEYLIIDENAGLWSFDVETGAYVEPLDMTSVASTLNNAFEGKDMRDVSQEQINAALYSILGAEGWRLVKMEQQPYIVIFERAIP